MKKGVEIEISLVAWFQGLRDQQTNRPTYMTSYRCAAEDKELFEIPRGNGTKGRSPRGP